jgi:hypothetical protein
MPRAAARTAGPQDACPGSSYPTTTDSAAAQPPSGPYTGAPTEYASSSICRSLNETPVLRTSARTRRSAAGSVIVCGVNRRSRPASTVSCTAGGANASSTSPTPVACSGQCAPIRVRTATAFRPAIRSMYTPSVPSRTASWTF